MRISNYLLAQHKEIPSDAELVSHQLMLRAGMIRKLTSGIYTWLPFGLKVLQKVEQIVRDEMNRAGAHEILMPSIQPAELWQQTDRWEKFGNELLKIQDRHDREFCYGPTHEEVIADIASKELKSYKQLPITLYQIQTKFRDEIRPRFGVMRSREFLMKDAYSFHTSQESLQATYDVMFSAYEKIFDRIGFHYRAVKADTGAMGGKESHEFHVLADSGEDSIAYSTDSNFAANFELLGEVKEGDPSPDGNGTLKIARGIEVGHIFQLGTRYSEAFNAHVLGEDGHSLPLTMGCYGIGISRIVAAAIEQSHDDRGIIWPESIAPFQVALLRINPHRSERVKTESEAIYEQLTQAGFDVLFDDRFERPGVQFSTSDLIGIPHRIVISEKGLEQNQIEYKQRNSEEVIMVDSDNLENFLHGAINTN